MIRIQLTAEQRRLMADSQRIAENVPLVRGKKKKQFVFVALERQKQSLALFKDPRRIP